MATPAQIVAAARRHIDTKWQHQARCPGVALDCIGLLVVVARELGIPHADFTRYDIRPDPAELLQQFESNLDRIDPSERRDGDVPLFWISAEDRPQHVGILTPRGFIHTHGGVGKVVEHVWAGAWPARLHSVWRFRGGLAWQP